DQSACGSCWAFGTVEAFNARVCIKSGGKLNQLLSAANMLACCNIGHFCLSFGCSGGNPITSWTFLHTNGIVSGGGFVPEKNMKAADGCWPYSFPKCAHHQDGSDYKPCAKEIYDTPSCSSSCPNAKYGTAFDKDRHYTESLFPSRFGSTSSIKKEIMTNGPTSAAFSVYEDFLSYKSGVYKHTSGGFLGGHAVEIIGWGTEKGVDYWLVMNSWNEEWGDHGTFKIVQGDCGIDDTILAGTPAMN
ncbi:Cathepsin B precursor, putative, partial [Perkinsus marinus ATCC 50983]